MKTLNKLSGILAMLWSVTGILMEVLIDIQLKKFNIWVNFKSVSNKIQMSVDTFVGVLLVLGIVITIFACAVSIASGRSPFKKGGLKWCTWIMLLASIIRFTGLLYLSDLLGIVAGIMMLLDKHAGEHVKAIDMSAA